MPIGTSFHAHPPFARIAINPTGHERIDRTRSSLAALLRPLTGERELYIAVPPGAGYRAFFSQRAGPCPGHFVSVAMRSVLPIAKYPDSCVPPPVLYDDAKAAI